VTPLVCGLAHDPRSECGVRGLPCVNAQTSPSRELRLRHRLPRAAADPTVQEIAMSKGNRGNKEAKKPKRVAPAVQTPVTVAVAPPAFKRNGPQERK
jgi:hypothetical protein